MGDGEHVVIEPRGDGGSEGLDGAEALPTEVDVLQGDDHQRGALGRWNGRPDSVQLSPRGDSESASVKGKANARAHRQT